VAILSTGNEPSPGRAGLGQIYDINRFTLTRSPHGAWRCLPDVVGHADDLDRAPTRRWPKTS
jgi:molybdopterin biosynthesis enzyme